MDIIWTQTAIRHLAAIRSYIEQDKPEAARRIAEHIIEASEHLAVHPHLGQPGRKAGTRELIVAHTPFIIPYKVHGNELIIFAVLHGAQNR